MNDAKIRKFLLAQMKKGKAAEKHANEEWEKIPDALKLMLAMRGEGEITLTYYDLQRMIDYTRMKAMAEWILIELYSSTKNDLGIELKVVK